MEITAKAKYLRLSPYKTRLVADVIRGADVVVAKNKLILLDKKATRPVAKLLQSAMASALHNYNLSEENLYIRAIRVDGGPILYRWMPKAFGRATPLRRRTCHISLILAEKVPSVTPSKKRRVKAAAASLVQEVANEPAPAKVADASREQNPKEALAAKKENAVKTAKQKFHAEPDRPVDRTGGKKQKGFLKKVFQRKSGS